MTVPVRALGVAVAVLLAAPAARAQLYDPAYRWRTIDTPNFRIHYHQGEDALAQDLARIAEAAHASLVERLGTRPSQRTEVVLSDDVDDANGSATPLPYDTIRIYVVPPAALSELNDYRDPLAAVFWHEYVHILHLDTVGGLPAAFNRVFGKLYVPNGLVPAWMIEGIAVVHEAEDDPGAGRNASALFDMYARALVLEPPGFPDLAEVSNNALLEWPIGHVPYLLGGRFMAYVEERFGRAAMAAFLREQGSQAWPYAPSRAGERWFGTSFPALWAEYAAYERLRADRFLEAVRARPVTHATRLTRRGGRVEGPRWSPDGSFIAYWHRGLDVRPGLFRVAPDGRDLGRVATVDLNGSLALRSPREALVAIGQVYREHRVYDDLYLVDLEGGRRRRLTRGERASDPDVARDGRTAVYVRRTGGGRMALVRRDLSAQGEAEVLLDRPGAQPFMPRVSPDGGRVAFELHEGGKRDVAIWSGGELVRVTDDDALDTGPAWSPDGRFLLFASDRGGVFNLYAWSVETGAVRQVTNVELGALQPDVSPDGRTIAFITYGRDGYDVATIPFDEASWMAPFPPPAVPARMAYGIVPAGAAAAATARSGAPLTPTLSPRSAGGEGEFVRGEGQREGQAASPTQAQAASPTPPLPSRPYSAFPTVLPTFWLPFWSLDSAGLITGAVTGGVDVLARHAWAAQAWWSWDVDEPGYSVAYQGGWSWPRLDLSSGRSIATVPGPSSGLEAVWTVADVGLSFTFTRVERALSLRLGWAGTRYDGVGPSDRALVPARLRFEDGFLSQGSATAIYSDARRFTRSISPEEGRTIGAALEVATPELGSDYAVSRLRGSAAQYVRVPFLGRHTVLALRAGAGLAEGTLGGRAPFDLGGVASAPASSLVLAATAPAPEQLRGYPAGTLEGTGYVAANLELRFPIAAPLLGRSTWPLFLRRVHGAVFLDAGEAFDRPGEIPLAGHDLRADLVRFGAGAELRLEVNLAYHLRTDVRIVAATPLGALLGDGRAVDDPLRLSPVQLYVAIGQSF